MKEAFKSFNSGRATVVLLAFISFVIALTVLKFTAPVFLPFTIGLLLAFALYPLVLALDKLHFPRFLSTFLVLVIILAGLYVFAMVLFRSGRTILSLYPKYESRLTEIYIWTARLFNISYNEDFTFFQNLWEQLGVRTMAVNMALSFSSFFFRFMQDALLVVLFTLFLLLEAGRFKEKLELAFEKRPGQIRQMGNDIMLQVTRYLTAKFLLSLVTGFIVAVLLGLVGLEFAIVWGLFQFVLNFIPSLGSIAAGVVVSLFALIQFWPDPTPVILVILIMVGTNMIIGNVIDPKVIGDNVGLSPLIVLASLVVWGYIWGFAGMILAVPLMVIIKIVCENFPFLEPVSILLSSRKAVHAKKAEQEKADEQPELWD